MSLPKELGLPPRILLVGDSITQQSFTLNGWGSLLANWFIRRADVINRGFSGYNTRWVRHSTAQIAASVPQGGPLILGTLFLGANDAAGNHQHVPLDEYAANLRALVRWMKEDVGVQRVVVMGPPPMDPAHHIRDRGLKPEEETRTDVAHAAYAGRAQAVAEELGCPFVDVRAGMLAALGARWREGLRDGLHLSAEGNEVTFHLLRAAVEKHFGDIVPEDHRPMLLPYHADPALHALPAFPLR